MKHKYYRQTLNLQDQHIQAQMPTENTNKNTSNYMLIISYSFHHNVNQEGIGNNRGLEKLSYIRWSGIYENTQ